MSQGIIGGVVQLFFGWRVKVLTGSNIAAAIIWFAGTVQCCKSRFEDSVITLLTKSTIVAGIGTGIAVIIVPEFLSKHLQSIISPL